MTYLAVISLWVLTKRKKKDGKYFFRFVLKVVSPITEKNGVIQHHRPSIFPFKPYYVYWGKVMKKDQSYFFVEFFVPICFFLNSGEKYFLVNHFSIIMECSYTFFVSYTTLSTSILWDHVWLRQWNLKSRLRYCHDFYVPYLASVEMMIYLFNALTTNLNENTKYDISGKEKYSNKIAFIKLF